MPYALLYTIVYAHCSTTSRSSAILAAVVIFEGGGGINVDLLAGPSAEVLELRIEAVELARDCRLPQHRTQLRAHGGRVAAS